jgi:hypothetical protein
MLPTPKPGTTYEALENEVTKTGSTFSMRAVDSQGYFALRHEIETAIRTVLHEFFIDSALIEIVVLPETYDCEYILLHGLGVRLFVTHQSERLSLDQAFATYYDV